MRENYVAHFPYFPKHGENSKKIELLPISRKVKIIWQHCDKFLFINFQKPLEYAKEVRLILFIEAY